MKKGKKYPYIWAWGMIMGSFPYFMEGESDKAEAEKAPRTSIYRRTGFDPKTGGELKGVWVTKDEIKDPMLKGRVEKLAEEFGGGEGK